MNNDFRNLLKLDKEKYQRENSLKYRIIYRVTKNPKYIYYLSIIVARKYNYYKTKNGFFSKINSLLYSFKFNKYATKYKIQLNYKEMGQQPTIYHSGILINSNSIIGDYVIFHGNNCIGNNGISESCPKIGDNVNVGYGAVIIGDITIGNNVIIGANAVVNKSIPDNCVVAGVPAKVIKVL